MEFNEHKPIYLQIADTLSDKILQGEWLPEDRIPSVREMGIDMGVNPNTIMRTYEYLQNRDIIYNKRGIGYFIAPDSKQLILSDQRQHFLSEELPAIVRKMKMLSITPDEITNLYDKN
ncbi:MAG: GntR family transcriptional regulator [Bacteroidales bacterium]|nr:GntR family transcriptional regulator [Bacteroidales bacterium]MDD4670180.1 GntR family transcriptional regulator [Bacteroidales bacterium]